MSITRTFVVRETERQMRRIGARNGEEIRRMREEAGVSLGALAEVVGVHKSHLARIERSEVQPSLHVLTAIGVALGAEISVRYFDGAGPRLHDRFQAPMIEALIRSVDPRWRADLEVAVTRPGRGVIDVVFTDRASPITLATEVYSELRRLEQQIRWSSEKADGLATRLAETQILAPQRDVSRLLILRSTVAMREIARRFESTLAAAYPARTRDVVRALTTPTSRWPGPGIAWMQLHGSVATLMRFPPHGVDLGR